MNECLYLWKLLFIVSSYKLGSRANPVPLADNTSAVLEVLAGETARIVCPSNDINHRFMFWHLNGKELLAPGDNVNTRKYKYEVLTGTLFIKAVSPKEYGIYTCYTSHISRRTLTSKSVLLMVKSDWEELWEDDEINFFRMTAIIVVVVVLCVAAYVIRNNMRHHQLMRFRDLTNDESANDDVSRNGSYDSPTNNRNLELREGIDNPTLDPDLRFSRESTPAFVYTRQNDY